MKPTGRFHPILKHEIMRLEEQDIKFWDKDWEDLTWDERADYCNFKQIEYLAANNKGTVATLYYSDAAKNREL